MGPQLDHRAVSFRILIDIDKTEVGMKLYPEHRAAVYQMRLDGVTIQDIANLYGVNRSTIRTNIKRESGELPRTKPIVAAPPAGYEPMVGGSRAAEALQEPIPLLVLFDDWIRQQRGLRHGRN